MSVQKTESGNVVFNATSTKVEIIAALGGSGDKVDALTKGIYNPVPEGTEFTLTGATVEAHILGKDKKKVEVVEFITSVGINIPVGSFFGCKVAKDGSLHRPSGAIATAVQGATDKLDAALKALKELKNKTLIASYEDFVKSSPFGDDGQRASVPTHTLKA